MKIFEKNQHLPGIAITSNGELFAIISKEKFFGIMGRSLMYDLFIKRKISFFLDAFPSPDMLILNKETPVSIAVSEALKRDSDQQHYPIIVDFGENDFKILAFEELILAQTHIHQLAIKQLNDVNEFKKEVLRIAAHDIRNPIGAIYGYSTLIVTNPEDTDKVSQYAELIHQLSLRINNLVNDLLGSAINDVSEIELEKTTFNLIETIRSVIENLKMKADEKQQSIIFTTREDILLIEADRYKISEVADNLISNALKYSAPTKNIAVHVFSDEKFAFLQVSDPGPGFSEDDLKNMYKKFQKLSAQPTGNETSVGLGLYITKKIIDLHKGKIDLKTQRGKGSTFTVKLPKHLR
ncbi:MAG: hypothetical protein HC906_13030 [Bacteroidales bacterium]|nr:hypothetical protein [Bacteroidales bacterium]